MTHYVATHKDLKVLRFSSPSQFRDWLAANHAQPESVWMQFAKKASSHSTISYLEARDEALCYGWIDSVLNKFDDDFYLVKFSHRRQKSIWSKVNVGVVEKLIAEGRMTPHGLKEIEAAKADGRWERAYEPQSTATVPEDLQEAIEANPRAAAFFKTLKGVNRYALIFRVNDAKSPTTREKRIADFVTMLAKGEAPYLIQPPTKKP